MPELLGRELIVGKLKKILHSMVLGVAKFAAIRPRTKTRLGFTFANIEVRYLLPVSTVGTLPTFSLS
jgi:hypothetical protein